MDTKNKKEYSKLENFKQEIQANYVVNFFRQYNDLFVYEKWILIKIYIII
jgi:hypothetical protein